MSRAGRLLDKIQEEVEKPMHIGVVSGIGRSVGKHHITAEFKGGYRVLGTYNTRGEAEADLPRVRRRHMSGYRPVPRKPGDE